MTTVFNYTQSILDNVTKTASSAISSTTEALASITTAATNSISGIGNVSTPAESENNDVSYTESKLNLNPPTNYNYNLNSINLNPLYVGCYSDNPNKYIMSEHLGTVNNKLECIKLGSNANLKYVGLISGDKCMGGNTIPSDLKVDKSKCNIVCNHTNSGYCGGNYYNQVYLTSEEYKTNNKIISEEKLNVKHEGSARNHLETFFNTQNDIKYINDNLLINVPQNKPINMFELYIWIIIIILIIFLLFEMCI